jgi:haloalkane dehalogenase
LSETGGALPAPESKYVTVKGAQMHYLEAGAGDPVLFVHGAPTSSYLWRDVIPHVAQVGRAIAFDSIGMGRSDKPDLEYRFWDHTDYLEGFVEALGLERLVIVTHDWGTRWALHWATRHRELVRGVAFSEAFLPTMTWDDLSEEFHDRFRQWRTPRIGHAQLVEENQFIETVLPMGIMRTLTTEEMEHYRAPFRDLASREMIYRFPNDHPISGEPADVTEAVQRYWRVMEDWDVPKLLFRVTPGAVCSEQFEEWAREHLSHLEVADLGEGRHFFPEDHPHQMGQELVSWLAREGLIQP